MAKTIGQRYVLQKGFQLIWSRGTGYGHAKKKVSDEVSWTRIGYPVWL